MQPNWSSVTVKACLCLKDHWRLVGQQCDDNLPEETADSFLERSKALSTLGDFLLPNRYFFKTVEVVELMLLVQTYFPEKKESLITQLILVLGKSKRYSLEGLPIPKLKLQAARRDPSCIDSQNRQNTMWSDNSTELQ